jgi:anthranilate synthase component 1
MYTPDFDEFCSLARHGNRVPIYREILADLETPVSAFLKIDDGGDAFLLESVEQAERWGRYSFLGVAPELVLRSRGRQVYVGPPSGEGAGQEVEDPLAAVKQLLAGYRPVAVPGLPPFSGGLVGYLGYDLVRFFERIPNTGEDDLHLWDQYLMLVDTLLVFDNTAHTIKVVSHAAVDEGADLRAAYSCTCEKIERLIARLRQPVRVPKGSRSKDGPPAIRSNVTQEQYEAMVRRAKEYIVAGDVIQVVLAQRFERARRASPFNIYRCLRTVEPAPYMFYLRVGGVQLIASSPELMLPLEGDEITVRPIAGTRPRGTSERSDAALERELCMDPKEVAEHIMLLDLGRNDVGRVARIGSVEVTERLVVERYAHVMHLVSNVRGRLRPGEDCFDAFRATFPAGTLTGAPKIRAMEIIEELEPVHRGVYGGAVGYFSFSGNMDTCITIRTIVVKDDKILVQAGAGIVADSEPEREHTECVNKSRAMLQAIRMAEELELEEEAHGPTPPHVGTE